VDSVGSVGVAAGAAALSGAIGLAALVAVSRRSVAWSVRLSPLVAVASIAAGVWAASSTMLLAPSQVRVMGLVLLVSTPIAALFGALGGSRVAALQSHAAELASARRQDRLAEERRRELIAWLSHDLRTPLARMRALTEAHEDGLAPEDYPTLMVREVDSLATIVDDIATLSQVQANPRAQRAEPVDLADLVSDSVASTRALAQSKGLQLTLSAPGVLLVTADPRQLGRAVENLLVNAIRHTPIGGHVGIEVAAGPDAATVRVSDECGGIREADLTRVFEPGWRGTSARTPGDAGAGLGLAITQGIVASHRGTVTVRNSGPGCTFTIVLPTTVMPAEEVTHE
jgi:signal transduction histidine kinase